MTAKKRHKKHTRVEGHRRFIVAANAPSTGSVLGFTTRGKFADSGPFKKFPTKPQALGFMASLRRRHPETAHYNLHVHEIAYVSKRKNPSAYARVRDSMLGELDRAADSYSQFSGRAPIHETHFKVDDGTKHKRAGFALGRLVAVTYRPERDGEPPGTLYEHKFSKSSQPLLIASDDGSRLELLGGAFQVTERGIEDR